MSGAEVICPCGTSKKYDDCCGVYITAKQLAPTAEALMRSRYSSFAMNEMDYIEKTHDPSNREGLDMEGNRTWATKAEWQGLQIQSVSQGGVDDDKGQVEFVAKYSMDGEDQQHHELSQFRKIKGQWYFVTGKNLDVVTYERQQPKVGRNDPCVCGSGKKYKKCCG